MKIGDVVDVAAGTAAIAIAWRLVERLVDVERDVYRLERLDRIWHGSGYRVVRRDQLRRALVEAVRLQQL